MKSVSPAIRKIARADVRAYCQEEFNARTKSTVSASLLNVIRFAQFMPLVAPACRAVALAEVGRSCISVASRLAPFSLARPQSTCSTRKQSRDAAPRLEEIMMARPRARTRPDDES